MADETEVGASRDCLASGAWIDDRILVLTPNYQGAEHEGREPIRGISTATFVRNMRAMIEYVRQGR